jgi:hypothetical protein
VYLIIIFLGKNFDEPTWENTFEASFKTPTNNAVLSFELVNSRATGYSDYHDAINK